VVVDGDEVLVNDEVMVATKTQRAINNNNKKKTKLIDQRHSVKKKKKKKSKQTTKCPAGNRVISHYQ